MGGTFCITPFAGEDAGRLEGVALVGVLVGG